MNQNQDVIIKFYKAFQQRDWKTMHTCYHADAQFSDPAFADLNYQEVKAMWHMLCENAQNFSLQYSEVAANGNEGNCRWDAWYTFSRSGRSVHNIIHAHFGFKDGLIIRHTDEFNFWRWSRMALGFSGLLLGWTPFLKEKVQKTARKSLVKFIGEHPQYSI
jgi:ketosteroid isomerase-like protein